jgi:hypothetical protein
VSDTLQLPQRVGRIGSSWWNYRPTGEEVAEWFATIKLHEGMEHTDWVTGITLIEATQKITEIAGFGDDNRPILVPDVQHLTYVPYPKVDTRIAYFHRLMALREGWTGFIIPVPAQNPSGMSVGLFAVKAKLPDGSVASLVCCSARVLVIEGTVEWVEQEDADGVKRRYPTGKTVIDAPPGTKSVPILNRWGKADENAVAKAQTGAAGRALGFAGMLVIPGTGVATAEDMQEALAGGQGSPGAPEPVVAAQPDQTAPGRFAEDDDNALRIRAAGIVAKLQSEYPAEMMAFQAWARERKHKRLEDINGAALKGLVKKLEKVLDEAQRQHPDSEIPTGLDISGVEEEQPKEKEAEEEATL